MSIFRTQSKGKTDLLIFYFLWPILIAPKEIQFAAIAILLADLLRRHKVRFDCLSFFMTGFIGVYFLSIVFNLMSGTYEWERILATVNTFSLWVFSLFFYLIFKSAAIDLEKVKKIAFVNYCLLIVLWICSGIVYVLTKSPKFEVLSRELYYTEWFGNMPVLRFVAFMDYPNLIIMFFMFFYPLFLSYLNHFDKRMLKVFLAILGFMPILSSFSRSGYVIIFSCLLMMAIYHLYRKINRKILMAASCFMISVGIWLLLYTPVTKEAVSIFQELLHAREGSNDSRSYLMAESIRMTFAESPLIGMGIKITSAIGYPLGSHSTYVGLFYKTGIAGFILGMLIFAWITLKVMWTKGDGQLVFLKITLIMLPFLFAVEDIDGANWLIIMYFLLVAVIFNERARKIAGANAGKEKTDGEIYRKGTVFGQSG